MGRSTVKINTTTSHHIEELPGKSYIDISGDVIALAISHATYNVKQVSDLIEALTEARFLADGGTREPPAEKRDPRVFAQGDPEPADMAKVMDCDGDVWFKGPKGWGLTKSRAGDGLGDDPWSHVLGYAPVTEVIES